MPERFGTALRRLRQAAGKTQRDFAKVLAVSTVYVSDVERGNRKPFTSARIFKVAALLNADPGPLILAGGSVTDRQLAADQRHLRQHPPRSRGDLVAGRCGRSDVPTGQDLPVRPDPSGSAPLQRLPDPIH